MLSATSYEAMTVSVSKLQRRIPRSTEVPCRPMPALDGVIQCQGAWRDMANGRTREVMRPDLQPRPCGWEGGYGFYSKEADLGAIKLKNNRNHPTAL